MKRFIKGFIFTLITVLSFTLASCRDQKTEEEPTTVPSEEVSGHVHTPEEEWNRDSAGHWKFCTSCDELIEMFGHNLGEWTVIEKQCKEKRVCSDCGYTTTRETEHTYGTGVKIDGECKEKKVCTNCNTETIVNISHVFIQGVCEGCGLEEGNVQVEQFYVRGTMNSWGTSDDYALTYSAKTKTATIQVTLNKGDNFKVANSSWADNCNFGFDTITFEEGLFSKANDNGDIEVLKTADYIVTVSGFADAIYSVNIELACEHQYGAAELIDKSCCKYAATCSKCNVVNEYIKHEFIDLDIICDACGTIDLKTYYVKGSFNDFSAHEDFALEYDESTYTATVDLWLQVGHSFKVGTADGWEFGYNEVVFTNAAKDAFVADGDANLYCVAYTEDPMGVKFTVTISGLNTLTHTMTIDTLEEYVKEDADIPAVSSGYYVLGTMNSWAANDLYSLSTSNGVHTITLELNAGDEFKVATGDWSSEFGFGKLTDNANFEESGEYGGNIKIKVAGTYVITLNGQSLTVTLQTNNPGDDTDEPTQGGSGDNTGGEDNPTPTPTPTPVDLPEYRVVGNFTSWGFDNEFYKLVVNNGALEILVQLYANDEFKVAVSTWTPELNYKNMTVDSTKIVAASTEEKPNAKVLVDGIYKIVVAGTTASHTCTITYVGPIACLSETGTHNLVDADCLNPQHCSVTGCRYTVGAPLGHTWDDGVEADGKITYTCEVVGCGATKQEVANADEVEGLLYFKPNSNWTQANARFAVYCWNDSGNVWVDLTDSNGDGIYEVIVPEGYTNIIFCRMNPSTTANNWNNKWTQTADLKVPTNGNNLYTITAGSWEAGSWSTK